jgi:hypothetical protein
VWVVAPSRKATVRGLGDEGPSGPDRWRDSWCPVSTPRTPLIMNTRTFSTWTTPTLALAMALLGAGCGSDSSTTDTANGTNATGSANGSGSTSSDPTATGTNASTGTDGRSDMATMDPNEIRINGATPGTPVYDERYAASKDIRSYRALLMAELEAIRTRLNDGTRPVEAAKEDQDRAADLAQGLERMDRLIKAVEESDDLTWTSIRESQLKEAGEVRTWASEHGYKVG